MYPTNNSENFAGQFRPMVDKLVSWCFEPSQPQRITSGLNIVMGSLNEIENTRLTTVKNSLYMMDPWLKIVTDALNETDLHG